MSREIKFKAWDKETNEIRSVMGYDYSKREVGLCSVPERKFGGGVLHTIHEIGRHIDDVILLQYTGLEDASGTEICEGDILKDVDGISGTVEVEDGNTYWNWLNVSTILSEVHDTVDVIGNIYENPELLDEVSE